MCVCVCSLTHFNKTVLVDSERDVTDLNSDGKLKLLYKNFFSTNFVNADSIIPVHSKDCFLVF